MQNGKEKEIYFEGINTTISKLLSNFVKNPKLLSHLLFVGPPGSGKTTTAYKLVEAFYGKNKHYIGNALFLNSSDERSLEAVRSKVYPFASSQIYKLFTDVNNNQIKPKIIIFDEAETLTEQAQSALRPLLDRPAHEILIIFLCNSISRIHSSIIYRFMRICFETPTPQQFKERYEPIQKIYKQTNKNTTDIRISTSDIHYRRGDIRFFLLQTNKARDCNNLGWNILHLPVSMIDDYIKKQLQTVYINELITQILFLFQKLGCVSINEINTLMVFADSDILNIRPLNDTINDLVKWTIDLKLKFNGLICQQNHS